MANTKRSGGYRQSGVKPRNQAAHLSDPGAPYRALGRSGLAAPFAPERLPDVAAAAMTAPPLVVGYMGGSDIVDVEIVTQRLGLSRVQLAETTGLAPATLHRTTRATAQKTQGRLREMLEIIGRVVDWSGGEVQALAWYRGQPIPAFGGRTAESLVKEGKATAVREYLDHLALGGFA